MDAGETLESKINRSEYKILIVDDVVSNVLLLKILLTNEKFQVITANNGTTCIEQARKEHPDLILLDVTLQHPEGNLDVVDDVLHVQLALHADDRKADDPVAGGRDLLHLHLAGGADEEDLRLRIQFLQFVRDRNGGEDVSSRPAAADDGAYGLILHILLRFRCFHP